MTRPFHIVDVFTERPYAGNPLAVVLDADAMTDAAMQRVAAEANFSETTFVMSGRERDGAFRVRIFTPAREIAFAGHPILGTGWVIRRHVLNDDADRVRLAIGAGIVDVDFEARADGGEVAWFRAPSMTLGTTCPAAPIADALGLAADDIASEAPVQQVSAGTSAMIVPLRDRDALRRSRLELTAFAPLAARGLPPLVYLYCHEAEDSRNDLCVRFFFEAHGVREDPATGNGAAFLGAYLLQHGLVAAAGFSLRIEQGSEVRRPSLVLLRGRDVGGAREVDVGGRVVAVVRGELL